MSYDLSIKRRPQKQIRHPPTESQHRVRISIMGLAENPRPDGTRRLRGRPGWRVRVGDHRVIYEIDEGGAWLPY